MQSVQNSAFFVTRILREINFGEYVKIEKMPFLQFVIWVNFRLQKALKVQKLIKINIHGI